MMRMKRILFDTSVHLGQFAISSEDVRIACKNSQASLSKKSVSDTIGIVTFNENSWADHIIWGLEREPQDAFYRFMDPFHSLVHIERVPLAVEDAEAARTIFERRGPDFSNALSCAVAISHRATEIHTLYPSMLEPGLVEWMHSTHGIQIVRPAPGPEKCFEDKGLEAMYQEALSTMRKNEIDLVSELHR